MIYYSEGYIDKIKSQILDMLKTYNEDEIIELKIGEIEGVSVCLVNGRAVEEKHDIDFVEASNWKADDYIPDNTIWIDINCDGVDWPHLIFHEYMESYVMEKYNLEYPEAHQVASDTETGFLYQWI